MKSVHDEWGKTSAALIGVEYSIVQMDQCLIGLSILHTVGCFQRLVLNQSAENILLLSRVACFSTHAILPQSVSSSRSPTAHPRPLVRLCGGAFISLRPEATVSVAHRLSS